MLLVGDDPLNQPRERLPPNIAVVKYAPYAQLFPRASVVVHQGGIGTTPQALRAGKQMIVVPCGGDQYDNAARIERVGAGLTITQKRYDRDRAIGALTKLIENPSYRERAEALGQQIRREDGVRVACDAIEEQLARE